MADAAIPVVPEYCATIMFVAPLAPLAPELVEKRPDQKEDEVRISNKAAPATVASDLVSAKGSQCINFSRTPKTIEKGLNAVQQLDKATLLRDFNAREKQA